MKIAILGSGRMGAALGQSWAAAGHHVTFTYARSDAKLQRLAQATGGAWASVPEAIPDADAVLLSAHWSRIPDVLKQAGELADKIVLNCCVPLDEDDANLLYGPSTCGAEELARLRPHARWVSCFNTIPSETFAPVRVRTLSPQPQVLMYGNDAGAKQVAQTLIRDAGFDALEAGGLTTGRYVEPFAMVTAVLAYGQPGGPALTYRFEKL
ncbi:NAD(P)-binding domain-containing protein [Donghicola sp. C2-DW-16]|uniref:NAD(P)-binding domain-containing protein n=1 Tax=Donghicola mangrovi TaxID=2729614 RepID=A0ABX2PCZ7_9RHOB|nr:NAD(P)-binding domain-containing protein [Donghicola mangrovi]NVO27243.1 NAD(P)-binding domain-containing protein [Donghicola mangrovi]